MFATVQPTQRWTSTVPLVLIILLGLILLGIAAVIVLSLISIYLPVRNINQVSSVSSASQQTTLTLSSPVNVTGGSRFDAATQTSIQNQMQNALSANSNTNGRANVQLNNAVGATSGKRKRRQEIVTINFVIVTYELIYTRICFTRRCQSRVLLFAQEIFSTLTITITGISSSGSSGSGGSSGSTSTVTESSTTSSLTDNEVTSDISLISQYWGNLRPYQDNSEDFFGVSNTGLPAGCQVEQAFILHRHAARYPAGSEVGTILSFLNKADQTNGSFTGLLTFLNTYSYQLGQDILVPDGASMEYASGVDFWDKYGRILYNAAAAQAFYNPVNQTNPLLRCNTIPRVTDSAVSWAAGFFGIYNATSKYSLLIIPAVPGFNNTLASFIACRNFLNTSYGMFDIVKSLYYPLQYYLQGAVTRLSQYVPSDVNLTVTDAFVMQQLCVYEYVVFGSSDFCSLFTLTEWRGFQYTLDLFVYNGFSFGSPSGRALGIGTLQELIARLNNQTISISNSSVNSTLDGSQSTFPLGQTFYLDMSHDFMIVGMLTAMSLDYFHQPLALNNFPPPEDRHFKTSYVIPYASRLITEKIGCISPNPAENNVTHTQYTPTQYGYSPQNATYKFIRMRLNSGILPLSTIRGGYCSNRTDGLCSLNNFLASQSNASNEANYGNICFGNYVYNSNAFTGDGNYFGP